MSLLIVPLLYPDLAGLLNVSHPLQHNFQVADESRVWTGTPPSAPPVDVVGAIYFAVGTALYPRPNPIPGVPLELFGTQYPAGKIFNIAAFTIPPIGQQGDFGRNVLRGFGATQLDFALQRQFHVTEKIGLRFRSEFFNIFNHPNLEIPATT